LTFAFNLDSQQERAYTVTILKNRSAKMDVGLNFFVWFGVVIVALVGKCVFDVLKSFK
jgi:hypothetical protein